MTHSRASTITRILTLAALVCASHSARATQPTKYAPLPEATSSFGAVACDNWLYVYGGHTAPTHAYSTEAVSGRFHRLDLTDGKTWEELPGGPRMQGMNLATYAGKIYRVGGMIPKNKPGEKADNWSTDQAVRFDPAAKKWEALPLSPEPRSSHDLAVVDGKLYVIGGWSMKGAAGGNKWLGGAVVLDLNAKDLKWEKLPQPFERRALIAASFDNKLYSIGGFDENSEPIQKVEIYDPKSATWSHGPDLPGKQQNGFAPAACALDGRLYISVADGTLLRLANDSKQWEKVAATTPRIVHRLVPSGSQILVIGGATRGGNMDLIEAVNIQPSPRADASPTPALTTDKLAATEQTVCPIMTGVLVGNDSKIVSYQGVEIKLCCPKCVKKWEAANPDSYLRKQFLPQLTAKTPEPAHPLNQIFCPVYGDRVVTPSDPWVMYNGKKLYFFNESAKQKWLANPAEYTAALNH